MLHSRGDTCCSTNSSGKSPESRYQRAWLCHAKTTTVTHHLSWTLDILCTFGGFHVRLGVARCFESQEHNEQSLFCMKGKVSGKSKTYTTPGKIAMACREESQRGGYVVGRSFLILCAPDCFHVRLGLSRCFRDCKAQAKHHTPVVSCRQNDRTGEHVPTKYPPKVGCLAF